MEEDEGMESQIERAMLSRVQHFTNQADSLTFEGVRRLLEEDMGLDPYALDVHKRFVKQLLEKYLKGDDDENASKNSGETLEENAGSTKGNDEGSPKKQDQKKKEPSSEEEEKMEDSPVMGLLTPNKSIKSEKIESHTSENNEIPSESNIKKAMWKRAAYFRANSDKITMGGVRRLLEEDLELGKKTLDPMKKFINEQLDEVLFSQSASVVMKNSAVNSKSKKPSKKIKTEESSALLVSKSEVIEDEVKSKKKVVPKGKVQKSEGLKKRKAPVKETKVSNKKQKRVTETKSVENSDAEDGGNLSEDSQSQSSAEKPVKKMQKKEVAPPAYGKHVERLKSIIKSCGMTVPPVVYKKAKRVPDEKRDSFLRKELEEILSREGLSANPSEKGKEKYRKIERKGGVPNEEMRGGMGGKEIKEVKKKKERAKELEGIDASNIVFSSRRRSTTSFVPPPKPKITVESDADDDSEDSENDDDEDDSDSGDDNDNGVDEGDDNKSEEVKEDVDEGDDNKGDDNKSEEVKEDVDEGDDNKSEEVKEGKP
ncbi:hypothetical protein LguiA_004452 [Lonicera macranthoides]